MAKVDESCAEKDEAVAMVSPEHYEGFVELSDKAMETIVQLILKDRVYQFNDYIKSGKLDSDEDIFKFFAVFLELIAYGRVAFHKDDHSLRFHKPIGPLPTEEMEAKIEKKINDFEPVIDKVLLSCLKSK
jgi:hypothetical protein